MAAVKFKKGDYVRLVPEGLEGQVIEQKTRTVTVRVREPDGELRERQVDPADVEPLPTTKEALLERPRTHPAPAMVFQPGVWISLDDAHVRKDRQPAWYTALRTLYGEFHDHGVQHTIVLGGYHGRRVLTISTVTGHEVLHHMRSAWDDHKLFLQHRDIPESRDLDVFQLIDFAGTAVLDNSKTFGNVFVSVKGPPAEMPPFAESAKRLLHKERKALGIEGGALFANDDDSHEVLYVRWPTRDDAEQFVNEARNHVVLPPTTRLGDEAEAYDFVEQI
jgi:hypothetical protein